MPTDPLKLYRQYLNSTPTVNSSSYVKSTQPSPVRPINTERIGPPSKPQTVIHYSSEGKPIGTRILDETKKPLPEPKTEAARQQREFTKTLHEHEQQEDKFGITDLTGNVIGTTSGVRSRHDILKAAKEHGGEVGVNIILPSKILGTEMKQPKPESGTLQSGVLSFLTPGYNIGVQTYYGGQKPPGALDENTEREIAIHSIYDPVSELVYTGKITKPISRSDYEASLAGNALIFLPAFLLGKAGKVGTPEPVLEPIQVKSTILSRLSPAQTSALKLAEGTREGNLVYDVSSLKGSKVFEFAQGTEKEQAQIPGALFEHKGTTVFIKSEPFEFIQPNKAIIKGVVPEKLVSELNLKEVPGQKNLYVGEITSKTRLIFESATKQGRIKPITDIYGFYSEDVLKGKGLYQYATRNPKEFLKFTDLTKPNIARYYETRGYSDRPVTKSSSLIELGSVGLKRSLSELDLPNVENVKTFKPFKALDTSNIGPGKIGAGASGKASALSKEKLIEIKDVLKSSNLFNIGKTQKSSNVFKSPFLKGGYDVEYEVIAFPKETKNSLKIKGIISFKDFLGSRTGSKLLLGEIYKQSQKQGLISLTGFRSGLKTITVPKFGQKTGLGLIQIPIPRYDTLPVPIITTIPVPKFPGPPTGTIFKFPSFPGFNLGGGTGGGGGRGSRRKKGFFVYSVNPFRAGAIAQAGYSGKLVSVSNIDIKFPKLKFNF